MSFSASWNSYPKEAFGTSYTPARVFNGVCESQKAAEFSAQVQNTSSSQNFYKKKPELQSNSFPGQFLG